MSTWNEATLSENPAINLLKKLGYTYVSSEKLAEDRDRFRDPVVWPRFEKAIRKLNPWISDGNVQQVKNQLTKINATSEIEINRMIHEMLVRYISVEQDRGEGRRPHTVKIIDFENPRSNEFIVTSQYNVVGPKKTIRCDVVCLVNGLPLVVIEAKNPTLRGSTPEMAIQQLHRYQDSELGAPELFRYTHILMAIARVHAYVGTNGTPLPHFLQWKDPFPMTEVELQQMLGRSPTVQDIAIAGVLRPENLLDIIQNYVVYEVSDGKIVKKVPRYQQYRAVNKTIRRLMDHWNIKEGESIRKRGGVIWHTQGSGKSLTMLFLATKLRRIPQLQNPTVLVVTDRVDLDKQITNTFKRCNFPNPVRARKTSHLKEVLSQIDQVPGQTILTTIHKFQESNRAKVYPTLAESENIIVLVDEAHRTQYKTLALNMRTAMPNATYIAFTGTPLIRSEKENITTSTFGGYIDTYPLQQAVEDGATVEILFESRLPELHVEKELLDQYIDVLVEDYTPEEQEKIKKRFGRLRTVVGAQQRIKRVALDIYEHFTTRIYANGFKAQLVALDRLTAARYKNELDRLMKGRMECAVIYTGGEAASYTKEENDEVAKYNTTKERQAELISRFKDPKDPLAMLIVVDMLLTGFDAPIEQVLYLDRPLRDHNLLQAIARVNRTYPGKTYGLVVDYIGISQSMNRALAVFDSEDVEHALIPFEEALRDLEVAHRNVMEMFQGIDRKDIDACVDALVASDRVEEFEQHAKAFEEALDVILPDPVANRFKEDYIFTVKLLEYLKNIGRSGLSLNYSELSQKIRELIDEHVRANGVKVIIPELSILDPNFEQTLDAYSHSEKASALMMEHALKMEISEKRERNPTFYESLSERLERLIKEYEERRLSDAEYLNQLKPLIREARQTRTVAQKLGLNEAQFAIYGHLMKKGGKDIKTLDENIRDLAVRISKEIGVLAGDPDWKFKEGLQKGIRKNIKLTLLDFDPSLREELTTQLIELAKAHY